MVEVIGRSDLVRYCYCFSNSVHCVAEITTYLLIFYRDMKSLNVLLNENNQAKIVDFGMAKLKNTSSMMTQSMLGTFAYMAPGM